MSLVNKRYADYYNNKHGITGHVFEKRFFDERISTNLSMLKIFSQEMSRKNGSNTMHSCIRKKMR
uniref:Uncharacterized protein n=1 Tax=Batrachochytrium dendrobatidis (strain JAM81 / FGSC 10211) TaxID=684364 RepID=F4PFV8_BATDJ|eukprot:XP_006683490.1 hypothetical protein BATDEDRAFT_93252 [Batrachochytrium dendrobatidis JAM81]